MTPAARVQAAIEVLDRIAHGAPAEQALTNWARSARYAGSGDRAAVRDRVFDCLRRRRSVAARGGGLSGRALLLGLLRQTDADLDAFFDGSRHGPDRLTEAERTSGQAPSEREAADVQDWVFDALQAQNADIAAVITAALRDRAPVFLRVNLGRADLSDVAAQLASEGISTAPVEGVPTALRVTTHPRRVQSSQAFRDGLVELQDAASQAVVNLLPLAPAAHVLDFCAGGGGKTLAMAARTNTPVQAHDANPQRMRDLPERARRAQARVDIVTSPRGVFDLVLCDVPCSGSGAWRRSPEGKWTLAPAGLADLQALQVEILETAARHVKEDGHLAYVTCSVLQSENGGTVDRFVQRNTAWARGAEHVFLPGPAGDGFYLNVLSRHHQS